MNYIASNFCNRQSKKKEKYKTAEMWMEKDGESESILHTITTWTHCWSSQIEYKPLRELTK